MSKRMVRYLIEVVREPGLRWDEYDHSHPASRDALIRLGYFRFGTELGYRRKLFPMPAGKTLVLEVLNFAGDQLRQRGHLRLAAIVEGSAT